MPRTGPGDPEVHQITTAATAHSDDLEARMTRYLLSMFVRTLCVIAVFVVDGPLRWVFAVGAVGLPYVAVIVANNSGPRRGRPATLGTPAARRAAVGAAGPAHPAAAAEPLVAGTGTEPVPHPAQAPEPLRDSA